MLEKFVREIEKNKLNVEGIRVLQGGKLLEEYRWIPEQPRLIYSCSKSFTCIAAGFAVAEGLFQLDDKVLDLLDLPQYAEEWSELTVRNLLTMSSGHEEATLLTEERKSIDCWLDAFFAKKRVYPPGEHFVYNNGCTYLISVIIQEKSGQKLSDYLESRLFHPLGFGKPYWAESPQGYTQGLTGLYLTTTQLGEFGQLLLDCGRKDGKQLISEEWIREATCKQISTCAPDEPDWNSGYGYFFWRCQNDCWRADGMQGQFIIVIERLQTVIAINSDEVRMQKILDCVWENILPILEDNQS